MAVKHVDDEEFKLVELEPVGDVFVEMLDGVDIEFMGCALLPNKYQLMCNTLATEKNVLGLNGTIIFYKVSDGEVVTMNEHDVFEINGVIQVQELFKGIK